MGAEPQAATAQAIVVCNSGVEISIIETPELLALPDGRPAVRWGGAAFPLLEGDRIEETGEAFPPSMCSRYATANETWRLVALEETGEAYLFLDGAAAERDVAVQQLQAAGIAVLRSGPNLSSQSGDWFIRLSGVTLADTSVIDAALGHRNSARSSTPAGIVRERLLSEALRQALARQEELTRQVQETSARSASAEQALPDLQAEVQALRQQLVDLARELAEPRSPPMLSREPHRQIARLEVELGVMVEELLPRLDLIRDSLQFIAVELSDRRAVWRALGELQRDDRGIPVGWKGVAGRTGWWERHVSTGHDNQGRIYARREGSPSRWKVLVSHKQQQDADIRNLSG